MLYELIEPIWNFGQKSQCEMAPPYFPILGKMGNFELNSSARRRWRRLAHRRAAPSARSAVRRAPSAEREAEIRLAAGAERVARGGASWPAGAARASSRSSNAGRLLPASATLTSFVGGRSKLCHQHLAVGPLLCRGGWWWWGGRHTRRETERALRTVHRDHTLGDTHKK